MSRRPSLTWVLTVLLATLAGAGLWLFRYEPALSAAPGYTLRTVTQPGFLEGYVRVLQNLADYTPCDYLLLGWGEADQLYYQEDCQAGTRVWRYSAGAGAAPVIVAMAPTDLRQIQADAIELVRAAGVRPTRYEAITRPLLLDPVAYASPDGAWIAVVSQHLYGPQDVLLIGMLQP